jgi:hypothetical protein
MGVQIFPKEIKKQNPDAHRGFVSYFPNKNKNESLSVYYANKACIVSPPAKKSPALTQVQGQPLKPVMPTGKTYKAVKLMFKVNGTSATMVTLWVTWL